MREDTRVLAEMAHAAAGGACDPCRGLDLGTGSGYVAIYLALRGWQMDAVDIDPRALRLAQHNAQMNHAAPHIYASDLFSAVNGAYEVIACNPPMRRHEGRMSYLVVTMLRRIEFLANLLMRVTQPVLERKRLGFLADIAAGARAHLAPGGRLLLVISPWEETELPMRVPGLTRIVGRPMKGIPGLCVVVFGFGGTANDGGQEEQGG